MAYGVRGERGIGVGGIEGAEDGGAEAFIIGESGVEDGNGKCAFARGRGPLPGHGGGIAFPGEQLGQVVDVVGLGERNAFLIGELRGEVGNVDAVGQENAIDTEFRIGGDDGAARAGEKEPEVVQGRAGAEADENFAGEVAGAPVDGGCDATRGSQRPNCVSEPFAKNADSREGGPLAQRAAFAAPVQTVVVRGNQLVEGFLYVGIPPEPFGGFLYGGVDLHLNAGDGKTFQQAGQRLPFDLQPEAVLIHPKFAHFCSGGKCGDQHKRQDLSGAKHEGNGSRVMNK